MVGLCATESVTGFVSGVSRFTLMLAFVSERAMPATPATKPKARRWQSAPGDRPCHFCAVIARLASGPTELGVREVVAHGTGQDEAYCKTTYLYERGRHRALGILLRSPLTSRRDSWF